MGLAINSIVRPVPALVFHRLIVNFQEIYIRKLADTEGKCHDIKKKKKAAIR